MLKFKDYRKMQAEYSAEKEKQLRAIKIEDLQASYSDLRELQSTILSLSEKKFSTELLLNAALFQAATIENQIKELGGSGFSSIDSTADFLYEITKK